ncbi:hypothetical protein RJ639_038909 [Escallonia herrerae]|uniref:Peptidase S59 domain-containing protein n=1 Tax=Escallonia herrerae TaxID=1293975 RepID=A0AA88WM38_9ASTE|nr:hypothetical protein RJ639_038909 [Escallonia herrerae]
MWKPPPLPCRHHHKTGPDWQMKVMNLNPLSNGHLCRNLSSNGHLRRTDHTQRHQHRDDHHLFLHDSHRYEKHLYRHAAATTTILGLIDCERAFTFEQKPNFDRSPCQFSSFESASQQTQSASGSNVSCSSSVSGASSQFSFGTSPFGLTAPAFVSSSTPISGFSAFGESSTQTIGASNQSAFGTFGVPLTASDFTSALGYGSLLEPTAGRAFGVSSAAAFGTGDANGSGTPSFGASSTLAASSADAYVSSPVIAFSSPFGTQTRMHAGSRVAPYSATVDQPEGNYPGISGKLESISAMPIHRLKSHEELRLEDYQLGDKGTQTRTHTGSRVAPYSATVDQPEGNYPGISGKLESISAMPIHRLKSHEELRLEDYQLGDKGGPELMGQRAGGVGIVTPTAHLNPSFFGSSPFGTFSPSFATTPLIGHRGSSLGVSTVPSSNTLSDPSSQSAFGTFSAPSLVSSAFRSLSVPILGSTGSSSGMSTAASSSGLSGIIPSPFWTKTFSPEVTASAWPAEVDAGGTLVSITAMPTHRNKSHEELRLEYYQTLQVSDKPPPAGVLKVMTIWHFAEGRNSILVHRHDSKGDNPKVLFSSDIQGTPNSENLSATNHTSIHVYEDGQIAVHVFAPDPSYEYNNYVQCNHGNFGGKEGASSAEGNLKSNLMREDNSTQETDLHTSVDYKLMPKLRHPDYYTEPRIQELAEKERAEPGFCCRVKDFVVGRHGYGSIKFLGETDVRKLDIESHVHFNAREVVVYMDKCKKSQVGQGLNKPAVVTLLNVKCIDKRTGKQYVDGPVVDKYREMLIKEAADKGGEFVSYDPAEGVWKFMVQHF